MKFGNTPDDIDKFLSNAKGATISCNIAQWEIDNREYRLSRYIYFQFLFILMEQDNKIIIRYI